MDQRTAPYRVADPSYLSGRVQDRRVASAENMEGIDDGIRVTGISLVASIRPGTDWLNGKSQRRRAPCNHDVNTH
jgi:hypothetical protein